MQHHASLVTADGAYHCPVGSIMAIFRNESVLECVSVSVFVRGGVSNLWRLGLSAHVGMAAP